MTFCLFRYDFWPEKRYKFLELRKIWLGAESNRRHVDFQSTALPTELPSLLPMKNALFSGGQKTAIDFMLTFSVSLAYVRDHETTNP